VNGAERVIFVCGSDDFLVDGRAAALFAETCGGNGEIFTFSSDGGLSAKVAAAVGALCSVPLFSDGNTLWLRSVPFPCEMSLSDDEKAAVTSLLESMRSSHGKTVIVSATGVDRRTKAFKDLERIAEVVDVGGDGRNAKIFERAIDEFAETNGVKIDDAAASLLLLKCDNNARLLEQEINKLSAYVFGKSDSIGEGDVSSLVDDQNYGNFFEPVEKFFGDDLNATLSAIGKYFFCNGDARALIAALQARNRLFIQLRALADSNRIKIDGGGVRSGDLMRAAKALSAENSPKSTFSVFSQNFWYLSKVAVQCANFELLTLLELQSALTSAISSTLDRPQNQKTLLSELAIRCFLRRVR
jgi:DNA polymerase III delta subunit